MYQVDYYNLDVIISVGYRVKSQRGTQFRIWASNLLKEYLKKGFVMDDDRLKNLGGGGYFKELLERIRDIRSSEKVFYRQVLEIYATSIDYDPKAEISIQFFQRSKTKFITQFMDKPRQRSSTTVQMQKKILWGSPHSREIIPR